MIPGQAGCLFNNPASWGFRGAQAQIPTPWPLPPGRALRNSSPPIPRPLPSPKKPGREGEKFFLGVICGAAAPQIAPKPQVSGYFHRVRVFCGAKAPQNTRNFFSPPRIFGEGPWEGHSSTLSPGAGETTFEVFLGTFGAQKHLKRSSPLPDFAMAKSGRGRGWGILGLYASEHRGMEVYGPCSRTCRGNTTNKVRLKY
jgi:hypothetical protein